MNMVTSLENDGGPREGIEEGACVEAVTTTPPQEDISKKGDRVTRLMDVVTSLEDGGDPDVIPRYEFDARTYM